MTNDPNAFLMGAGGRSATFKSVKDAVDGWIVDFAMRQQTAFGSGTAKFYDDGNPMMQLVITLQTKIADDEDDDMIRRVYAKGQILQAIRKAVADAGARGLAVDGRLYIRYTGDGKAEKNMNPPKQYIAKYQPPVQASVPAAADDGYDVAPPPDDADAPF